MQDIEQTLLTIHAEIKGFAHAAGDKGDLDLVGELAIDSIVALELIARVEEEFGIVISDEDITPELVASYRVLADYIRDKLRPAAKGPTID